VRMKPRQASLGSVRSGMADVPVRTKRSYLLRSIYAGRDLELFLVTAIATILIVRAALAATGWPQLGGGKIHFAHLLWGGLGMLVALVIFMAFKGRLWDQLATLAAGIGFGLFIDELGKFITSDNDYFFRPAVAMIYLIFVALFLLTRAIVTSDRLSQQAALANLLTLMSEAAVRPWDEPERAQALHLLAASDQSDPVVRDLAPIITSMVAQTSRRLGPYERLKTRLANFCVSLVGRRWFKALLVGYLALIAVGGLSLGLAVILAASGQGGETATMSFWTYGEAVSASVGGVLVVVGFVRWRRSRLAAHGWFLRALLVGIFVTQFFAFYHNQITQAFGLVVVLLTYAAIRAMIRNEESRQRTSAHGDQT
jgi:hypothetical protein